MGFILGYIVYGLVCVERFRSKQCVRGALGMLVVNHILCFTPMNPTFACIKVVVSAVCRCMSTAGYSIMRERDTHDLMRYMPSEISESESTPFQLLEFASFTDRLQYPDFSR